MVIAPGTPMYHVGCGLHLYDYQPRQTIAITCPCGAGGPICIPALDHPIALQSSIPVSLVMGLEHGKTLPHLEYYLGFSTFHCLAKSVWAKALRNLGSTPMAECTEPGCREYASKKQAQLHGESR